MKNRVNVIKESYSSYRFKNDRYKVSADYEEYNRIATKFFELLFKKIVTSGLEIELPSRMGCFVIEQYNVKEYTEKLESENKTFWRTDKLNEKKFFLKYGYKRKIEYDSSDTDGKMWTFSWIKNKNGSFKAKSLYSFQLVRSNVRSSSNKAYSDKTKRLTVHDFYKEIGYKIYKNILKPSYNNKKNKEI